MIIMADMLSHIQSVSQMDTEQKESAVPDFLKLTGDFLEKILV